MHLQTYQSVGELSTNTGIRRLSVGHIDEDVISENLFAYSPRRKPIRLLMYSHVVQQHNSGEVGKLVIHASRSYYFQDNNNSGIYIARFCKRTPNALRVLA